MVNEYDSEKSRDDAFARWLRRQRTATWITNALLVAWVAWFVCWIRADFAEGKAIMEACGPQATLDCIGEAREAYRRGR